MCIELSSLQTTATSCVLSLKVELQCPPCQLPFTGQDSYGSDVLAPYHRMSGSSIYVSADSAPGARVRPPPAARSSSWDPPLSSDPSRRAGSALPGYGRRCSRVSPPSAAPPPDLGVLKSAPSCSFCVWFVRSYLQGNDPRSSAYPGRAPTHPRPPGPRRRERPFLPAGAGALGSLPARGLGPTLALLLPPAWNAELVLRRTVLGFFLLHPFPSTPASRDWTLQAWSQVPHDAFLFAFGVASCSTFTNSPRPGTMKVMGKSMCHVCTPSWASVLILRIALWIRATLSLHVLPKQNPGHREVH